MNSSFLLLLAAICYTAPFIWPSYCGYIIFIFPSFLFVALTRYHPSKKTIVYWSLTVTIIHLLAICDALFFMASGPLLLRCLPPCFLLLYVTCYPAIWLLMTQWLLRWCKQYMGLFCWTMSLWLYLLVIDQELLWVFGRHEGYIFMNPLVPLASWPTYLQYTSFVSPPIALLWFCIMSSAITAIFLWYKPILYGALICALLPWCWPAPTYSPPWLANVGHLPILLAHTIDNQMGTLLIDHEITKLQSQHPLITTIITPESAWNSHSLAQVTQLPITAFSITTVLIGGFAKEFHGYFNRLYCFKDGSLHQYYDKQHALPLVERTSFFTSMIANRLFFQKTPPITPSHNPKKPILLPAIGPFIPYICSELFCTTYPDPYPYPILCLVNDWWFRMPHFQRLMVLAARLQAIRWHRPILYISFYYAQFFDELGIGMPIATTPLDRFIA